jgi:hypothetical protein
VTSCVIGYRTNNDSSYYSGLIDEVRIYDYPLSQADIVSQFEADGGTLPTTCISRALVADFDDNCYVNMDDFAYMAGVWLTDDGTADIAPEETDDIVDLLDLIALTQQWLECVDPTDAGCL